MCLTYSNNLCIEYISHNTKLRYIHQLHVSATFDLAIIRFDTNIGETIYIMQYKSQLSRTVHYSVIQNNTKAIISVSLNGGTSSCLQPVGGIPPLDCGIMHPRCCRPPAGHIVGALYHKSSAPEDGQNNYPKNVELTGIINKPLLLHLVGCLYYLYCIIFF